MIEARNLSKRFGKTQAVDNLSFSVLAGQVTGFLGPNGSGKSTTMRMIMALDAPSAGTVTVDGHDYRTLRFPLREVGALLDATAAHPGRKTRDHLNWLAYSNKIPRRRVDEVLGIVGLSDAAHRRAGELSLGMGQRLGIAAALLGDPRVLILDEPINGLDPEGILWVRHLLRSLADEGRTVLVSSHLMTEMALTADHLIIIGRGQLLSSGSVADFIERSGGHHVRVVTPDAEALGALLRAKGADVVSDHPHELRVEGIESRDVGIAAARAGLTLYELSTKRASLEDAFMELTHSHAQYQGTTQPAMASAS